MPSPSLGASSLAWEGGKSLRADSQLLCKVGLGSCPLWASFVPGEMKSLDKSIFRALIVRLRDFPGRVQTCLIAPGRRASTSHTLSPSDLSGEVKNFGVQSSSLPFGELRAG